MKANTNPAREWSEPASGTRVENFEDRKMSKEQIETPDSEIVAVPPRPMPVRMTLDLVVNDRVAELERLLGQPVVLLPIRAGQKAPEFQGWNEVRPEQMQDPGYRGQLYAGNIGVLLGAPSDGLCSIDIDRDEFVEPFLELNPALRPALRTRGSRGANIWIRVQGQFPTLTSLRTKDGANWGEWRADGGQTVIDGQHPDGHPYARIVNGPPAQLAFGEIRWPEELALPWGDSDYHRLVEQFGSPYSKSSRGTLKLNQQWFAGRFANEHELLFEAQELEFYEYNELNGLWELKTVNSLKCQLARDLKTAADAFCEPRMALEITDSLTSALVNVLKGQVEQSGVFEKLPRIIHLRNGMLDLKENPPRLMPFDPGYHSRNQIPFDYDAQAVCPRFEQDLLGAALSLDDIRLLKRWCGSVLLGTNLPQRLMIFHGDAAAGKSTTAEIVEGIIGTRNVANLRTDHLKDRFELFAYVGKTLLAGKDVAGNFLNLEGSHIVKALCGGDLLDAEKKNGGRLQIKGDYNILITSNSRLWLKLDGDAGAWKRRLLIVEYGQRRETRNIPEFAKVLLREEGPGILNFMIAGAVELLGELDRHGTYVLTQEQEARIERLVSESNSVQEFVRAWLTPEPRINVTTNELVEAYMEFCQERQWHPLPAHTVQRQLPDAMMEVHHVAPRHDVGRGGSDHRGYDGINITRGARHGA